MIKIKKFTKLPDAPKSYKPKHGGDILFGEEYIVGKVEKEDIKSIVMLSAIRADTFSNGDKLAGYVWVWYNK